MENIYYSPEAYGLEVVGECEFSDLDYQFDTRVVWKTTDPKPVMYYTARDEGCSCPTPFEEYQHINDLAIFNYDELVAEAHQELKDEIEHYHHGTVDAIGDWIRKVWEIQCEINQLEVANV